MNRQPLQRISHTRGRKNTCPRQVCRTLLCNEVTQSTLILNWNEHQRNPHSQQSVSQSYMYQSFLVISKQRNESTLLFRAQKQRSTCSKSKRTTEAADRVQITRRKNLERAIDGFAQISITRNNKYVSFGA